MNQYIRFGEVAVDLGAGRVTRSGRELVLEPRTFDVLVYMLQHPDRLVRHEELLQQVWRDTHVTSHSLTQAISQLRQVLEDDPHQPRYVQTVHRRGYRWLAPVVVDAPRKDAEHPAIAGRWGLPAAAAQLIVREDLIQMVCASLVHARQVTLVGPGGIGKTQLALEVGRRVQSHFRNGALLVDLASEVDGAGVARALAQQLRIDTGELASSMGILAAALRDRNVLLLLDNCEQVALAVTTLSTELLASCPEVRILATSQRNLGITGQQLIGVPPLSLPPNDWSPTPEEDPAEWPGSVQLFVERARAINPELQVTQQNAGAIGEICRRLDGIPLALELAAARTNVMTPAQIADRLEERMQLLTSPHPSTQSRQVPLPASIAWSVSLLSASAQRVLERLSVFRGGWTLETAQAVTGIINTSELVDDLAGLVSKSLVVVDINRPQARFRLLDTIHLFLHERLIESAEHARIRDSHLKCFHRFSDEVERESLGNPMPWLGRVREERANLREALVWAIATPRNAESGLQICCNLRWAWRLEGSYVESRDWLVEALAAATCAAPSLLGKAWIVLGLIHHHRGDFEAARASVQKGLSLLPSEDRWERSFGTMLLAYVETLGGSLDEADILAAASEREIDTLGDDRLLGFARVREAVASGLRSRHEEAALLLEKAEEHLMHGQDPFLRTFSKVQLGLQRYLSGRLEAAREAAIEVLRDGSALENLRMVAGGIEVLAYLALEAQDARQGARLLGAAARLREVTAAPMLANFGPVHSQANARLVECLGRDAFELEFQAGVGAPLAEIIHPLLGR